MKGERVSGIVLRGGGLECFWRGEVWFFFFCGCSIFLHPSWLGRRKELFWGEIRQWKRVG